ncbi:heterokaryon incompatibility protein-domain-containing protein [Hypoxylon sp. NC1633]|nr:heterokaryon incompatibility protein-domain-containing protein [Hypoxylon sp. NC1633]
MAADMVTFSEAPDQGLNDSPRSIEPTDLGVLPLSLSPSVESADGDDPIPMTSPTLTDFENDKRSSITFVNLDPHQMFIGMASGMVQSILQELCRRDARFTFISLAIKGFIASPEFKQNYPSFMHLENLGMFSLPTTSLEFFIEAGGPLERVEEKGAEITVLSATLLEVIDSTIYELLKVLEIDLVPAQVPAHMSLASHGKLFASLSKHFIESRSEPIVSEPPRPKDHWQRIFDLTTGKVPAYTSFLSYCKLPVRLYRSLVGSRPKPIISESSRPKDLGEKKSHYPCSNALDATADQVRVLQIHPGEEETRLRCDLKVRKLDDEGIEQALSYVWGQGQRGETILVNGQNFLVTKHLLTILHDLRKQDTTREIWIDAICINQEDEAEKTHQVRLMSRIYSEARSTLIWLGGPTTQQLRDQKTGVEFDPSDIHAPLPEGFGGHEIDQNDLCSLVEKSEECFSDAQWEEKQWSLCLMLYRHLLQLLSHSWWERVWTIQEGVLPSQPPTVFFRGHFFSFEHLTTATRLVMQGKHRWNHGEWIPIAVEGIFSNDGLLSVAAVVLSQFSRLPVMNTRKSFTFRSDTWRGDPGSLSRCLDSTISCCASDGRDKIFALQSLLPGCIGLLIKVDYAESYEVVFTRITARCYASIARLSMLSNFRLSVEAQVGASKGLPSWVIDFSYSNTIHKNNEFANSPRDLVTMAGFLYSRLQSHLEENRSLHSPYCPRFATPSTLFCTGVDVDTVYRTGLIPGSSTGSSHADSQSAFYIFVVELYNERQKRLGVAERPIFPDLSDAYLKPDKEKIKHYFNFFLLRTEDVISHAEEADPSFLRARLDAIAGRPYFITKKGFIGIATVPINEGDRLCLLHTAPVYFILREVESQNQKLQGLQAHRIVARAAVLDEVDDVKGQIESLPIRSFRII